MGKLRRGGFIFVWWKGDHPPRHVHVYRDGKLLIKWDLDNKKAMKGRAMRRIVDLIEKLESEGIL
jgi:Domain of unknown function (DUF4160)